MFTFMAESTYMDKEKSGLLKSFGLNMAIILVVSNIIGSGVFKKVAPMSAGLLSPNLVLLAWVLAGVVTLFGVLTIAEAGTMFPHSGGAYSWLEKMYGKTISFFYGWSCFTVIQTAAIASIAFVFAGALGNFVDLPNLSNGSDKVVTNSVYLRNDSLYADLDCGHTTYFFHSPELELYASGINNNRLSVDSSYYSNGGVMVELH